MINKVGNRWKYTCPNCPFVPDKVPIFTDFLDDEWKCSWVSPDPDYIQTHRISKRTGEYGKKPLNFPDRCNACKARYRRATRMGKRMDRIHDVAKETPKCSIPKLITFALPSQWFTWESPSSRDEQMQRLDSLLPKARQVLQDNGVLGGSYVLECTFKWIPDLENFTHPQYKFHAHVHMVAIAPFVQRATLADWCAQLMPLGLGRINYEAVKSRKKTAEYVSKYLIKDKVQCRTFGIMRGRTSTTQQNTA
jgi:hypothetical protein